MTTKGVSEPALRAVARSSSLYSGGCATSFVDGGKGSYVAQTGREIDATA